MRANTAMKSVVVILFSLFMFSLFTQAFATAVPVQSSDTKAEISVVETLTEIGDNYIRYPQLSGMADPAIQQRINDQIVDSASIVQRMITLSTLPEGSTGLQVDYEAFLSGMIFSTVISAKGIMQTMRSGHEYTALTFDLNTGGQVELSDLFQNPDTAAAWMESQLEDGFMDELSVYLEHSNALPLPVHSFMLDENGITFFYPYQQFALLSDYSGAVQFQYGELQQYFITDSSSVPAQLGIVLPEYTDEQVKKNIEDILLQGTLPYLPVKLGNAVGDLITAYRLARTPDQYPGGRYIQLEAPAFRDILILTDALTSDYTMSVVRGFLATRMNLYGIRTGVTSQADWRRILGDPDPSVELDASVAADYGLPAVTADYYTLSDRRLILYADTDGILYAVRLEN